MYSGKIAVPPGGGGIRKKEIRINLPKDLAHYLVKVIFIVKVYS
jgi:hypothetical protein